MDYNVFRPKKSGKKPKAALPPAPPPAPLPEVRNNGENGHHHHHHDHHYPGAGRLEDGYMDPLDHLSSIRRLNSIDISHATNVKMNFRDFTDADAEFYTGRGPSPYGYPDQYAIEHRHGGPVGLPPPPPPMYMMPPPPPPQQLGYGPRPARYQPFHFYNGEDPNNCSVM